MLTLGEAAREVGRTKPAIANAIKSGRISATRDDKGQYQIDPAELFRVYPAKGKELGETIPHESTTLQRENALLREQLATAKEERERERALLQTQLERERQQADQWRQQATALLTHQREPSAEPPEPEPLGAFWVSIVSIVATLSALALGAALMFHWWR